MSHELLAVTVKLSDARLLAAVRAAVESGLLASTGDGYSFTHALIRQVVYSHALPSKQALLHRRLAEVLADRPGSDPGLLSRHWHRAGCPDRAAAAAVLAARHAVSVRAYPEAVKNYGLAIELMNWLPAAGPDLQEEAARSAGRAIPDRPLPGRRPRLPKRAPPLHRWTAPGGWSGSGVTGGKRATSRRPSMPPSRPWPYSIQSRRPGCRLACWPRWPPGGCCLVRRIPPCPW